MGAQGIPQLPEELLKQIRHGEDYRLEYKEAKTDLPKKYFVPTK